MELELERENATYERERANLAAEHEGYTVLIKGDDIVGVYVAYEDAISVGYDKFGLEGFFCKEIHAAEPVIWIDSPIELVEVAIASCETNFENEIAGVTIPLSMEDSAMEFKLDREMAIYERERGNLAAEGEGKFVLIKGDQIAGIYADFEDAMSVGYEKFGLDSFLCKEVHAIEPELDIF